jgi:hypothetical protein
MDRVGSVATFVKVVDAGGFAAAARAAEPIAQRVY